MFSHLCRIQQGTLQMSHGERIFIGTITPYWQRNSANRTLIQIQATPSIWGGGKAGTLFPKIAALPLCSKIPSLPQRCRTASPSSSPVCLASALPSFTTSRVATSCHPPKDSTANGTKSIPSLLHSSAAPLIFLSKANSSACPGLMAHQSVSIWFG